MCINDFVIQKYHINKEILSIFQKEFYSYNQKIENINFNEPISLRIYCMYQDMMLTVEKFDYYYIEQELCSPEETCRSIILNYEEEIKQQDNKIWENIQQERKKLKEMILSDEEFHRCTNKTLRKTYGNKIIKNNSKYKKLFLNNGHGWYDVPIDDYIELLWREYKEICNKSTVTEYSIKR